MRRKINLVVAMVISQPKKKFQLGSWLHVVSQVAVLGEP